MKQQSINIMQKLLKPVSREQMKEIVLSRTGPGSYEGLTLADAGLEEEVQEIFADKNSRAISVG